MDLPIYGCDPALQHWGSKSGSRRDFARRRSQLPGGFEDLRDAAAFWAALVELRMRPQLRQAVVKLNEGFSGEGNAIFDFGGAPRGGGLEAWVADGCPASPSRRTT